MGMNNISIKYLSDWIDSGGVDSITKKYPESLDAEIDSNESITLFLEAFNNIEFEIKISNYHNTVNENLLHLILLLQDVSDEIVFESIKTKIIPNLISFYDILYSNYKSITNNEDLDLDLLFLKVFAIYGNEEGITIIANKFLNGLKADSYLWSIIIKLIGYEKYKTNLFLEKINFISPDKLSKGFILSSYLELANMHMFQLEDEDICPESIEGYELLHSHLFNNEEGFKILKKAISSKNSDSFSTAVSATTAIPFLNKEYQDVLLPLSREHPFIDVSIESAWSGSKIGHENSIKQLIEYSKDYHYALKSINYLEELGLKKYLPESSKDKEFMALAEMSDWLRHPNEFGAYPDKAEIHDKRELFWPPLNQVKELFIVKYSYDFWNVDGTTEHGLGLVGSVTFSLFDVDTLDKSPLEIYAIHCAWELGLENYEDPNVGLNILSEYNDI